MGVVCLRKNVSCVVPCVCSSGLEEQNGNLAEVEVDKVLGLVCDVRAKVAANNAVPSGVVLLVKLLEKRQKGGEE